MTAGFIDTPGVPLGSASAPVRFFATEAVPALSVRFGDDRVEERAFRDGVFLYPYLGSTKDGTTYTLRRSGGWPRIVDPVTKKLLPVTVYIDEEAGPPTGGQTWGGIYDLDFTALTDDTIPLTAAGEHEIDDLTWWAKNPIGTGTIHLDSSGLRWIAGNDTFSPTFSTVSRVLCLPLANVPGFNPDAPCQVWFHQERTSGNSGINMGIIDTTADAAGMTVGQAPGTFLAYPDANGTGWSRVQNQANNGFTGVAHTHPWTTLEYGILVATAYTDLLLMANDYTGGPMPSGPSFAYGPWIVNGRAAPRANPTIAFAPNYLADVTVKRLTILQPKVAA